MKKKKNLAMIGIAVFLAAAFNINQSQNNMIFSDLALENVEALARNETDTGTTCTVTSYIEYRYQGCLYSAARCAEGHIQLLHLIKCYAR